MRPEERIADPAHVAGQYRDSSKFDARVRLYRFRAAGQPHFPDWLFERLRFEPRDRVLDVGCGTGNLWLDNARRIPRELEITLVDLSPGMLAEAERRLAGCGRPFAYRDADVQSLPFGEECFDVVVANHMLYHVPDRTAGLAEIQRVLARGGRFYATTNDWTHLIEMRELAERFGLDGALLPPRRDPDFFDLETAAHEISAHFPCFGLARCIGSLEVTEVDPFMDYVRSVTSETPANEEPLASLASHVRGVIARMGSMHITTSIGLFEAVR